MKLANADADRVSRTLSGARRRSCCHRKNKHSARICHPATSKRGVAGRLVDQLHPSKRTSQIQRGCRAIEHLQTARDGCGGRWVADGIWTPISSRGAHGRKRLILLEKTGEPRGNRTVPTVTSFLAAGYRTVLVLESNDIALSNATEVGQAFLDGPPAESSLMRLLSGLDCSDKDRP